MVYQFRPYWLLSFLSLLGLSFLYISVLQGGSTILLSIPIFEWGSEGSVTRYAGMVLNRALSAAYPAFMLYAFFVLAMYALLQVFALYFDMRCQRRSLSESPCSNWQHWKAILVAPVLGRPLKRFTNINQWSSVHWRDYLDQAPMPLLSPISVSIQVFPLLGFIGTIAGIASALKFLPTGDNPDSSVENLTLSLYTAFDTTFIGLVASLILILMHSGMEYAWGRMQKEMFPDS